MEISLDQFVRFTLCLIRFLTLLTAMPLFNMRSIPMQAKIGLSALCALLVMPPLTVGGAAESFASLFMLAVHEVAVGLILSLVVTLTFGVIQFAGQLVDVPVGFGMASIFDPVQGVQMPVFSQFYHVLTVLIFFGIDAHLWILRALARSYEFIPFDAIINMEFTFNTIMDLGKNIFTIGLQIAIPVMGAILLADFGLGIVVRSVPQVNVFVIGFPVKIMIGMVVILFAVPAFVSLASQLFAVDGYLFRHFYSIIAAGGT